MRKALTYFLACLGLAGLSENIVEWQEWFQYGVLAHWTTFKAAITGILPFDVPDFILDYLAVGTLFVQSSLMMVDWAELLKTSERDANAHWAYKAYLAFFGLLVVGLRLLRIAFTWPLDLYSTIRCAFDGDMPEDYRAEFRHQLRNFGYLIIAFVPFLFVCSNLLEVLGAKI